MASLLINSGQEDERYFPLESHKLIIVGRDDECTVQVLDDQVSRKHLQIRLDSDEEKHYAADYRSANGVFINDNRIVDEKQLTDGDSIRIGNTTIAYLQDDHSDVESAKDALRKMDEWKRSTLLND